MNETEKIKKKMKTSIKQNLAYQGFYEVLNMILPLFTSPYISRVVGVEGLGIFSYTYSIAYYFQLFGMLGIKFYGNRAIARVRNDRNETNRIFSEILTVHIIISIICTAIYVIYVIFDKQYQLYSALQVFMVLASLFDISWFFFGIEEFKTTVVRNTIIKIASVACIFIFVHKSSDLWKYVFIMSLSQLIGNLILFIISKNYVRYMMPQIGDICKHLKPMLVLFIPVISTSIFKYMDKIMLGLIGDKIELGYYENAEKILNIPLSIILSFGSVMLPKMSNLLANKDNKAASRYIEMSIKYMSCISIAMAFGMAGIAVNFAPIFWGSAFAPSGILIMMLSISLPFTTIANIVRNQDLIPNGKDKYYSIAIIVGAVSNLIINWILIPRLHSLGVTIGTITSEILVCIVQMFMIDKSIPYRKYIRNAMVFLPSGILMFLIVQFVGNRFGASIAVLLLQIFVGAIVYGGINLSYFAVTKDEQFVNIVNKIKKVI